MKFSKSLINDKEFGHKFFNSRLNKAQSLLTDVFELDFTGNDSKVIDELKIPEQFKYSIKFKFNGRELTAKFQFVYCLEDLFTETFEIKEIAVIKVPLVAPANDFKSVVNEILEILEEKYDINFTPLDPDEEDTNIKKVILREADTRWVATFITNDHEAVFKAEYTLIDKQPLLRITQYKTHIIYFE